MTCAGESETSLHRNRTDKRLNLVKILYENSNIKLTVTETWVMRVWSLTV